MENIETIAFGKLMRKSQWWRQSYRKLQLLVGLVQEHVVLLVDRSVAVSAVSRKYLESSSHTTGFRLLIA